MAAAPPGVSRSLSSVSSAVSVVGVATRVGRDIAGHSLAEGGRFLGGRVVGDKSWVSRP